MFDTQLGTFEEMIRMTCQDSMDIQPSTLEVPFAPISRRYIANSTSTATSNYHTLSTDSGM